MNEIHLNENTEAINKEKFLYKHDRDKKVKIANNKVQTVE